MQTPNGTLSSQTKHQANSSYPGNHERSYPLPPYSPPNERWKTVGYPMFSRWMASSHDFFVVRRFARLSARALLLLQDDLVRLEETIEQMDEYSRDMRPSVGGTGSFRLDIDNAQRDNPRDKAMREATAKLKEYYELLGHVSAIRNRPDANPTQVRNVQNWFKNEFGAIDRRERDFITKKGDLIAVVHHPKSLFRLWLEQSRYFRRLIRLPDDPEHVDRIASDSNEYFSERCFDYSTSALIITVGLAMLLVPMWWLELMGSSIAKLGVITGFVVFFSLLLFGSLANTTMGFEVLAATAAYAAVLAVFLQVHMPD